MEDMISVLIVDDNAVFCEVLCEYLNRCEDMVVKGVAKDGAEAIDMIQELSPQIVILDLIMPNIDGIGVLERISEMQLKNVPIFIMLTAIGKDIFIQKAIELGAEYYILKPFDIDILVSRIRQIHDEKAAMHEKKLAMLVNDELTVKCNLEQIITGLIKGLGIQPNKNGYHYLREAVILSMESTNLRDSILHVYDTIADNHHTSAKNVTRGIRCAIDEAYKILRNADISELKLPIKLNLGRKPTNIQMITLLADKTRSEMKPSTSKTRIS